MSYSNYLEDDSYFFPSIKKMAQCMLGNGMYCDILEALLTHIYDTTEAFMFTKKTEAFYLIT